MEVRETGFLEEGGSAGVRVRGSVLPTTATAKKTMKTMKTMKAMKTTTKKKTEKKIEEKTEEKTGKKRGEGKAEKMKTTASPEGGQAGKAFRNSGYIYANGFEVQYARLYFEPRLDFPEWRKKEGSASQTYTAPTGGRSLDDLLALPIRRFLPRPVDMLVLNVGKHLRASCGGLDGDSDTVNKLDCAREKYAKVAQWLMRVKAEKYVREKNEEK